MSAKYSDDHILIADPRYEDAIALFNKRQWYAAHDLFEELWHESHGSIRSMLQGIIQLSVAEFHLENSNIRGSILLMAEGLNHLKCLGPLDVSLDLEALIQCASSRLSCLQANEKMLDIPIPFLSRLAPQTL